MPVQKKKKKPVSFVGVTPKERGDMLTMSLVKYANRSTSWFSRNDPYRLRSLARFRSVSRPETREPMLPDGDWNARRIQ